MRSRQLHRYLGLILVLPMLCWAVTGMVFFIKPGYQAAYDIPQLKTYPLQQGIHVPDNASWQAARLVRSVLGHHLLVTDEQQQRHLNPDTLKPMPVPDKAELKRLFKDALAKNSDRYGTIERIEQTTAYTNNDIEVTLDWRTLSLSQKGPDRALIDLLYQIHYLQWTPWASVNQILGFLGLILVASLAVLGLRMFLKR